MATKIMMIVNIVDSIATSSSKRTPMEEKTFIPNILHNPCQFLAAIVSAIILMEVLEFVAISLEVSK